MKICGKVLRPLARVDHLFASLAVSGYVDLMELNALAGQQFLGVGTIRAIWDGVDIDRCHGDACNFCQISYILYGRSPGLGNPGKNQHIDIGGAGPQQCPRAALDRGAGGQDIIDQDQASAGDRGLALLRHTKRALDIGRRARPATGRLAARSALTRLSAPAAMGTPLSAEIVAASMADWLKRRAHSRRQCSGTGTSASASARSSRPAWRPSVPSSARGRAGRHISARGPARAKSRRTAPRRGRGYRPAGRRWLPWTGCPDPGHTRRECRAARNRGG